MKLPNTNPRRPDRRRKHKKGLTSILSLVLIVVLVTSLTIGGTLAFLQNPSNTVTNSFELGQITYTLNLNANATKVGHQDNEVTMPATLEPTSPHSTTELSVPFTADAVPTLAGYTFNGWHYEAACTTDYTDASNDGKTITVKYGDIHDTNPAPNQVEIALYADWTANTDTPYRVEHHLQNILDDEYTIYNQDTQNLTGTTDSEVTPAVKTYEGFTSPSEQTVTIKGDGTTVVIYKYDRNKYNVTLTEGNGIASVSGAGTYKYGAIVNVGAVVKDGYTWRDWTGEATKTEQTFSFPMPAKNVTYTANTTLNTYNITYTLNGGTISTANPTTYTVETPTFTLNNPTKTGYIFAGWTGSNGTTAQTTVTVTKGSTGNKEYAANWTPITYNVQYNANTGSGSMSNSTHTYDVSSTLTANAFTKTGYQFTGWNTKADGTGTSYADKATITNLTTTDGATITLYAQWKQMDFTLSFDTQVNGVTANPTSKTVTFDQPYGELATATRPGYTLEGWYLDTALTKKVESTTTVAIESDHTVYAKWKVNTYTVKYNANAVGVTGTMADQKFTYDETGFLRYNAFSRTGYDFVGWALDPNSTEAVYLDHAFVSNLTTGSEITLYAVWSAGKIVVTFDTQYAEVQANPPTKLVTFNEKYGTLPTVEIEGYQFLGWYTAKSGGTKVTADTKVTNAQHHTLYAHWETPNIDLLMMFEGSGVNKFETFAKHDYQYNSAITYTGQTINGEWESFCIRLSNLIPGATYQLKFDASFSDRTCIRSYNYDEPKNDQSAKTYPIGCRVEETSSFAETGSTREYTWTPSHKNKSTNDFVIEFVATKDTMFWQWELSKVRNPGEAYYGRSGKTGEKTWKSGVANFEESYFDLTLSEVSLTMIPAYIDFAETAGNTTNKNGDPAGSFTLNNSTATSANFKYVGAAGLWEKVRIPINGLLVGQTYTVSYTMETNANSSQFDQAIGKSSELTNEYEYGPNKVVFSQTVNKNVSGSFNFEATDTTMYWIWGMTGITNGTEYTFKINATIALNQNATPTVLNIPATLEVELPEGVTKGEEIILTEMPDMAELEASVATENKQFYGWMVDGFFGSEIYMPDQLEEILEGVFADAAEYGDEVELHIFPLYTDAPAATDPTDTVSTDPTATDPAPTGPAPTGAAPTGPAPTEPVKEEQKQNLLVALFDQVKDALIPTEPKAKVAPTAAATTPPTTPATVPATEKEVTGE